MKVTLCVNEKDSIPILTEVNNGRYKTYNIYQFIPDNSRLLVLENAYLPVLNVVRLGRSLYVNAIRIILDKERLSVL